MLAEKKEMSIKVLLQDMKAGGMYIEKIKPTDDAKLIVVIIKSIKHKEQAAIAWYLLDATITASRVQKKNIKKTMAINSVPVKPAF